MFKSVDPHPKFPELEKKILEYWEKNKVFEKSLEQTRDGEPFVFYEGPPTANGRPGLHHVEARSFKDLVPRYQTMRGRFVARQAGWDTHGLPVEIQVEKKLGISGKQEIESLKATVKESIAYFNQLCRESVWEFKEDWEKLTARMGFWIDLDNPYITYENSYIEKVWGILKQIYDKGLIYQGHKVVPYCPRCGTALSSHEVAQGYETVTDESVFVKFRVKDRKDTYILSWTTTPWTLPGNVALAVGEDIKYLVLSIKGTDERYIVAEDLAGEILDTKYEILYTVSGKDLAGLRYQPLFEIPALKSPKSHKVYPADFVSTEEGTGIVHTAVMYGEDDYQLGEETGLPKHHTVDENGKFTDDLKEYGLTGMSVKEPETEQKITQHLKQNNLLFKQERYEHEYPHCWRCDSALLYYARNSWFIRMSDQREALMANNQNINWVPAHIKDGRFGEWIAEAKDWAISRERYWGTPIPIWKCGDCDELTVVESAQELGIEKEMDLHRPFIDEVKLKCEKCGGEAERTPEVLDVWFDSGAMPFASGVSGYPADYIAEAIDQTRGWFYTLLAISTLLDKGNSYKNVVCLGLLLDEKGQKMSKSKGNIVDPWDVGNKFGFDVLRWYFYSVNQPGDNKLFSERDLQVVSRKVFRILWNVYNYFVTYANDAGWKHEPQKPYQPEHIMDRWINARLQELIKKTTDYFDQYDTVRATRGVESFIDDLSTWYIRRSRGRADHEFFSTLYHVLIHLAKAMAPAAPFMAEAVYQNIRHPDYEDSVHLSEWPEAKEEEIDKELLKQMEKVREIVEKVHALRAQEGIKLRQPLAKLTISENGLRPTDSGLLAILKDEVNVKEITEGDKLELDTKLTEELKLEGLAAELARQINNFRKDSGLQIGQKAELYYEIPRTEDTEQTRTNAEMIDKAFALVDKEKIYAGKLEQGRPEKADYETEVEIESKTVKLYLKI